MRLLKIAGIVLGSLIVLIVIALLAVRLFVNPNDYKDRIAAAVRQSTGRELSLPGRIQLAVFPWIALELGPASLGNPPGFGAAPFAAVQHVAVRVKLLPLLRGHLQIGRIDIDGLDLRLLTNAAGQGNWQGLGGRSASAASAANTPSGGSTALPDLAGVVLRDSRVSYQDMVASGVNLSIGRVAAGVAIPVSVKLELARGGGAAPATLAGRFEVTLDPAARRYRLAALALGGTVSPAAHAAPVAWQLAAPQVSVDLGAQTLDAPALTVQLGGAHLGVRASASHIADAPAVTGSFTLAPVALRMLATQLGVTVPATRDPKALSKFAAAGMFSYGAQALSASGLDIQLDDSTLRGSAAITDLHTRASRFDLTLDHIDLDRYRAPEAATGGRDQSAAQGAAASADLPTDLLRTLNTSGSFALGSATVAGLQLTQLQLALMAQGGLAHLNVTHAGLYGGQDTGTLTLDARGAVPALMINQRLSGVDVAALLKDFIHSQRLSGRGTLNVDLAARGRNSDAWLGSLSGRVTADLAGGAIQGIDLGADINRAVALLQQRSLPAVGAAALAAGGGGQTRFDTFRMSADVSNGVATTKDLVIGTQNLRITAQGTANLVTRAIDYHAQAAVLAAAGTKNTGARTLADVPFTVTGTLTSPTVRPDLQGMAKARAQQELESHKAQLQQKLKGALKGLFK
jgi:AsmA protein